MFDVEKMKKLNDLAKELQKHNFADDSQEAYKFAEKIYAEKASDIFGSSIPEASQTEPEVQAESVRVETQKEDSSNNELLERKYQLILEMNNKRFNEELISLKQQVQDVNSEIERLRLVVRRLEEQGMTQKQVERQETINIVDKKEVPKESNPRQGDFKSSDVPIEKSFYFGK